MPCLFGLSYAMYSWGFPKIRATFFAGPLNNIVRTIAFSGPYCDSPIPANYQISYIQGSRTIDLTTFRIAPERTPFPRATISAWTSRIRKNSQKQLERTLHVGLRVEGLQDRVGG